MDFSANKGLANTAIVPVDGTLKFYLGLPALVTTNVIADAVGYFKAPGDATGLNILANGQRVMRYEYNATSPNVIGGHPNNSVMTGACGATVAGGGQAGNNCFDPVTGMPTRSCANEALDIFATDGGFSNTAGLQSTVGGGSDNIASGPFSTVGGGFSNTAPGDSSTVPGGLFNAASGKYSLAAGNQAHADQDGCFVFANWSTFPGSPPSCLSNKYIAHFFFDHGLVVDYGSANMSGSGMKWLAIGDTSATNTIIAWNNAKLTDTGVWVNGSSSKATKTDFAPVDVRQVLAKVARLPITTWRFKEGEGEVWHMGPMAEDFDAAFGIGYGPQTIADLDARGVEFAAIQGLHQMMQQKDARLSQQAREISVLKRELNAIKLKLGLNE